MIELKRRTPEERKAYFDGYRAGMEVTLEAMKQLAASTGDAIEAAMAKIKRDVDTMIEIAGRQ